MFHANGWGMPFAMTGLGVPHIVLRKVDGAEILRRVEKYGVTVHVRGTGGRRGGARGRADLGGRDPGPRPGPDHHGRRPAADEDRRPGGGGARLGVHPDLRPHRDLAAAHRSTAPAPSGTTCSAEERAAQAGPRRRARRSAYASRSKSRRTRSTAGEVLARSNVVLEGYWEQPEETERALADGWFHTGDGGVHRRRRLPHDPGPQEGRDHHRRRERLVDRGRGRAVLAPGGRRGRRDRRPRARSGARRSRRSSCWPRARRPPRPS